MKALHNPTARNKSFDVSLIPTGCMHTNTSNLQCQVSEAPLVCSDILSHSSWISFKESTSGCQIATSCSIIDTCIFIPSDTLPSIRSNNRSSCHQVLLSIGICFHYQFILPFRYVMSIQQRRVLAFTSW